MLRVVRFRASVDRVGAVDLGRSLLLIGRSSRIVTGEVRLIESVSLVDEALGVTRLGLARLQWVLGVIGRLLDTVVGERAAMSPTTTYGPYELSP